MNPITNLRCSEVESFIIGLTHSEIADFRELLEVNNNRNYLLRSLYYDYINQSWIAPERIQL